MAEEEAARKAKEDEEAKRKAEAAAKRKAKRLKEEAEEAKRNAEEEAARKAKEDEAAKRKAEAAAKRKAKRLEEEAKRVYPFKHQNALNTVGFKEWFDYWDGKTESKERVIELIQQNSRHYAKRQLTWFKRDADITWFHPDDEVQIVDWVTSQ
jgi:tRNA A37 N6-isopentenylltransferase MiaA